MPIRKVGSDTPISETVSSTCDSHGAAPQRRVDAHRNADDEREQRRDQRQLERRRQALGDQRRDLAPLPQAQARIALQRALDESGELDVERPVEAEQLGHARAVLVGRVLAEHEGDRIADVVEQRERDERHRQHHDTACPSRRRTNASIESLGSGCVEIRKTPW